MKNLARLSEYELEQRLLGGSMPISWKVLAALLLIVGLLAGVKYLFDVIEKKSQPRS